ncbi:antibiotic biosynthesis monooxygenase [Piscinibacterium candidicorallinum]|uniref:Antibiotic biosynthesis monooxygenase n=1 Tax=Piscinibacterium candidicorallinum TaxID=1793872 RepID=A0ABV7H7R5_9BURK
MNIETFTARLRHRLLKTGLVASALVALGACSINTPYPRLATPEAAAQAPVVLVLTHATLDPKRRESFDVHTRRVLAEMTRQPGLLGYSARREIFGTQAWTLTIWASEADLARFMNSPVHREAVRKGMEGLVAMESKRLLLKRDALPTSWDQALALLKDPEGRRAYWE